MGFRDGRDLEAGYGRRPETLLRRHSLSRLTSQKECLYFRGVVP